MLYLHDHNEISPAGHSVMRKKLTKFGDDIIIIDRVMTSQNFQYDIKL